MQKLEPILGKLTMNPKKVLFYSHDTLGLGHIRRTQKIANDLAGPDVAILVICSSPKASDYRSEPGIEYLKLPGFTKLKTGAYIPRNLNVELEEFVKLRSQIILSAIQSFEPDVFVVDKEPLGVKGELKAGLDFIKANGGKTHTICGIRDILDKPEFIAKEWARRGSEQALIEYYDSVIVYGDQNIYDFQKEYNFSEELNPKLHYMGYILQNENENRQAGYQEAFEKQEDKPLVTFSLGGGEDGDDFLSVFVEAMKKYQDDINFQTLIVTGPFLSNGRYAGFCERVQGLKDLTMVNFHPDMYGILKQSDVLVTMGGYNTFCECLSLKKQPIILPRIRPREEQLIRAQIFKAKGLCDYIHPDELTEDQLFAKIQEKLNSRQEGNYEFKKDGLAETVRFIRSRTQNFSPSLRVVVKG
ncbi:MAG: glycosyltransferase [Pseudomonadota bacterium]